MLPIRGRLQPTRRPSRKAAEAAVDDLFGYDMPAKPRGIPTPEEKRKYLNDRRRLLERKLKGKRT